MERGKRIHHVERLRRGVVPSSIARHQERGIVRAWGGAKRGVRVMELMQNVVEYGDARSLGVVTGVRRIFLISPHIVRITFVRADMRDDGTPEHRVSGHVDWEVDHLLAANALIRQALVQLLLPPEAKIGARLLMTH
jgi:hypothetical protein